MSGLSKRQISNLAPMPGGIPGAKPFKRGTYTQYFPVVWSPELEQWAKDRRATTKKVRLKKRKTLKLLERGGHATEFFKALTSVRAYVEELESYKWKPGEGGLDYRIPEDAYSIHLRLMGFAKFYAKLKKVMAEAKDQQWIKQYMSDWRGWTPDKPIKG
ncbi:hypothetical protein [Roseimicrobium gellanilyticum]|nr:hypothetical protein [Roseimicrobium gellanilyticum]